MVETSAYQFLVHAKGTRTCEGRIVMDSKRCRYKRAVPRAFSLPFISKDDSATWTCFTYTIRFQNFKPGTDPMQHSASDFLLLSPQPLDEEASNICVHLNLPAFASVESKFAYCGVLNVSREKVRLRPLGMINFLHQLVLMFHHAPHCINC